MILLVSSLILSGNIALQKDVLGAFKPVSALVDGNYQTSAVSTSERKEFIVQLGKANYIKSVVLHLKKPLPDYVVVEMSMDFFSWFSKVKKKVKSKTVAFRFKHSPVAMFVKVSFLSKRKVKVAEVEIFSAKGKRNKIYDVKIKDVTENSVVISWKTEEPSQDHIVMARERRGRRTKIVDAGYKKNHTAFIKNLEKGHWYEFIIVSETPDGRKIESDVFRFRTRGIPYPEFVLVKSPSITPHSADIKADTNVPTKANLTLRFPSGEVKKFSSDTFKTNHTFKVSGLKQETVYSFMVSAVDRFGNEVSTSWLSFTTPANNIALGKRVFGTFNNTSKDITSHGGYNSITNVVDGDLNYFTGMAVSFKVANADQYVVVDLGKVEPVKRIDVYWWGLAYSRDYQIDVSDDGKNWRVIERGIDAEDGSEVRSPRGDLLVKQSIVSKFRARFVRLLARAGSSVGTRIKKWPALPVLYLSEVAVIKDED